jgi:bacillithiol biosynthesis cysteine-adding enzyme BshC
MVPPVAEYIAYADTHAFSHLITDYLASEPFLTPFRAFPLGIEGIRQAIAERKLHPVDRASLVTTLRLQYHHFPLSAATAANIEALTSPESFSICTAHQPNLMTGYLYFIYKIVHTIRLAHDLNALFPANHFVPVYYLGSEDNDLDELSKFRYGSDTYTWDAGGQTGAVGRMATPSLAPLIAELFRHLGPPGPNLDTIKQLITDAYMLHDDISSATLFLVNELFGRYGLVVLNPDSAALKRAFIPVMKADLFHQSSLTTVSNTISALGERYKVQAHPRPINLFYLKDSIRERIELNKDFWNVLNTDIRWSRQELETELSTWPERFSPNVILRPLFQETILPNVVFIGGGSEVAYWLQLKSLFEQHHVFFPAVHLRQSIWWMEPRAAKLLERLNISLADAFLPAGEILKMLVDQKRASSYSLDAEMKELEATFAHIHERAIQTDPTLGGAASAALARMKKHADRLSHKMLRAEKRKLSLEHQWIANLHQFVFPGGVLQERSDSFLSLFLKYGPAFIDIIFDNVDVSRASFLVLSESE